jgi:aminoglycoside phosphotransferase (APT) family kinase protein
LTEIGKVEEGLSTLFQELRGEGVRIVALKDITVGWETQIVTFTLDVPCEEPLDLVVRIYSGNNGTQKAEWEFNVMQRLGLVGYPVPRVYVYEAGMETLGSPFLIMERITGGTLWDVFFSAPKERYREVLALNLSLMARLHDIPVNRILPILYRVRTRRRVLGRVREEAKELKRYGLEAAFEPLVSWLERSAKHISESPLCIIHQDFHPRNILLRSDGSPVVIDWAGCTVGDFREDLCWTALLAGTFIDEGLKQSVYDAYREVSFRVLVDLSYFEVYTGLRRLADMAVMLRAGAATRGMRTEAMTEMKNNRLHYSKVLSSVTNVIGFEMPELTHILKV